MLTGTLWEGGASSLVANDNSFFVVRTGSFSSGPSWYGTFAGVPASATDLRLSFSGGSSRTCTLTLAAYRWSNATWATLAQQSLGTTEVAVSAQLAGATSQYRGPNGEVRLRVVVRGLVLRHNPLEHRPADALVPLLDRRFDVRTGAGQQLS